jgi:hypothetical protein
MQATALDEARSSSQWPISHPRFRLRSWQRQHSSWSPWPSVRRHLSRNEGLIAYLDGPLLLFTAHPTGASVPHCKEIACAFISGNSRDYAAEPRRWTFEPICQGGYERMQCIPRCRLGDHVHYHTRFSSQSQGTSARTDRLECSTS